MQYLDRGTLIPVLINRFVGYLTQKLTYVAALWVIMKVGMMIIDTWVAAQKKLGELACDESRVKAFREALVTEEALKQDLDAVLAQPEEDVRAFPRVDHSKEIEVLDGLIEQKTTEVKSLHGQIATLTVEILRAESEREKVLSSGELAPSTTDDVKLREAERDIAQLTVDRAHLDARYQTMYRQLDEMIGQRRVLDTAGSVESRELLHPLVPVTRAEFGVISHNFGKPEQLDYLGRVLAASSTASTPSVAKALRVRVARRIATSIRIFVPYPNLIQQPGARAQVDHLLNVELNRLHVRFCDREDVMVATLLLLYQPSFTERISRVDLSLLEKALVNIVGIQLLCPAAIRVSRYF